MTHFLSLLLALTGSISFAADLDAATALQLIKARQDAIGKPLQGKILSIEDMGKIKGSTLYRVNVKYGKSEQTYQLRYPQKSKDGLTDVVLTTYINSQPTTAKYVKLSEYDLAQYVQIATDAGTVKLKKEFPDIEPTGVYVFANGERFKEPRAVILTYQLFYKGMKVPLLRRVYVQRESKKAEVGYED